MNRRRTSFVLLFLLITLAVAGGLTLRLVLDTPLSAGEQSMIGRWRLRWDGAEADLPLEYEFRPDRTCVVRRFDPTTGAVVDAVEYPWRRTGDRLAIELTDVGVAVPWWKPFRPRYATEVLVLTSDGPDRFRYTATIEAHRPISPPVSGVLARAGRGP